MMKKGITLVEVVVAMAIFTTVITLSVGGFITVSRMKALTSAMKEVQQKMRIANEMISRLSRQAEKVNATSTELTLYFDIYNTEPDKGTKFRIGGAPLTLYSSECITMDAVTKTCESNGWGPETDLLGGTIILEGTSYFQKDSGVPPMLNYKIGGVINNISDNPYYSNDFEINNSIILENVK